MDIFNAYFCKDSARVQSLVGKDDYFKTLVYTASSIHWIDIAEVKMTYSLRIQFDDEVKNLTINWQITFEFPRQRNLQMPLLKKELGICTDSPLSNTLVMSLSPFDLKQITKKFENTLRHLKFTGYLDFGKKFGGEDIGENDLKKPVRIETDNVVTFLLDIKY